MILELNISEQFDIELYTAHNSVLRELELLKDLFISLDNCFFVDKGDKHFQNKLQNIDKPIAVSFDIADISQDELRIKIAMNILDKFLKYTNQFEFSIHQISHSVSYGRIKLTSLDNYSLPIYPITFFAKARQHWKNPQKISELLSF